MRARCVISSLTAAAVKCTVFKSWCCFASLHIFGCFHLLDELIRCIFLVNADCMWSLQHILHYYCWRISIKHFGDAILYLFPDDSPSWHWPVCSVLIKLSRNVLRICIWISSCSYDSAESPRIPTVSLTVLGSSNWWEQSWIFAQPPQQCAFLRYSSYSGENQKIQSHLSILSDLLILCWTIDNALCQQYHAIPYARLS